MEVEIEEKLKNKRTCEQKGSVAKGLMNGAPTESQTHLSRFDSKSF